MKSNLILKQFETDKVKGTMNVRDLRTFFGGKIAYIEDLISVNDDSVEFSYVSTGKNVGYQYYDKNIPDDWETDFVENLTDLKDNYHSITLLNQTSTNLNINTRWKIEISAKNILRDYLFFKFKESRIFQSINYDDLYNNGINDSIYNYIDWNIMSSYKFETLDFYISYSNIPQIQSIKKNILLQYSPDFTEDVYVNSNKTSDFNMINVDQFNFDKIVINYYQTKPSNVYKFDYYFDLKFIKI